ncbi:MULTISPECIES: hypothetical protein [Solibacillus]|uniref:Uncharacterized protein n=1 Tax=Solibacillus merdavium TaxID=2762218 RepID=A0ABR8XIM9_9BACL|nr:hypothetical protein [Solibacillus merdavium]MBD8031803.1 hypothetical protein [Solibacillus merdavium]
MISLLKIHFYLSRKLLFTAFLFIIGLIAIQWVILREINLGFVTIYFISLTPVLSISYLLENHFIRKFRVMPIAPKDFVKSLFIFSLLQILIILLPIGIYQTIIYSDNQIEAFELSFIVIFFTAGIASIGSMLKNYLSNPSQGTKSISIWSIIGYLFIFTIVHFFIMLIFSIMDIKLMGAIFLPIIGLIVYYQYYKTAVTKFKTAEF